MDFKQFLLETQTISQYIKNQKEFSPQLYQSIKPELKKRLMVVMPRLGNSIDRYVNWLAYWGIRKYFEENKWRFNSNDKNFAPDALQVVTGNIARGCMGYITNVGDFIIAHLNDNRIQSKFNTIEYTPEQAREDSKEWHDQIALTQSKPGGPGKVLLYLDRLGPQWIGWRWKTLGRGYCKEEANAAGHCGNANAKSGDNILSLRDPQNHVHLTFIVNDGVLGEMKGRANAKPSPKYHVPILALLQSKNVGSMVGGGWDDANNFHLTDLPKETQQELLKKKPLLNNPFQYAIKNVKDNKQLQIKINELLDESIESVITNESGEKEAVVESFKNFTEIDAVKRSYPNSKIESVGWLDDPYRDNDNDYAYSNDALRDYLEYLSKENEMTLEKCVDNALEEFYGDEEDEDEDEDLSLYEKLRKEDGEIKSSVQHAISDGMTSGAEGEAFNDVKKSLESPDSNGFYFQLWVSSKDEHQLRISLTDLATLYNSGTTNPKEAVEIDYSPPHYGYSDFDKEAFNERLADLLHDLAKDLVPTESVMSFQNWIIARNKTVNGNCINHFPDRPVFPNPSLPNPNPSLNNLVPFWETSFPLKHEKP